MSLSVSAGTAPPASPRTRLLLHGAILPTLLPPRLAQHPGHAGAGLDASTGLIETWWVSHLCTDALAGI